MDGAFGAKHPNMIASIQAGGGAHLHVDLGPVGQLVENIDVVGYSDRGRKPILVLAVGHVDFGHGHHAVAPAQPSHHGLVGCPDVQGVVTAERPVVTPVHRPVEIGEVVLQRREIHRQQLTQMSFVNQMFQDVIDCVAGRCWSQLTHQVGMGPGSGEHVAGFRGGGRHAGFGEHVLSSFQGRQSHGAVHVRPGADAHGVDVVVVQQLPPVPVYRRNVELIGDGSP